MKVFSAVKEMLVGLVGSYMAMLLMIPVVLTIAAILGVGLTLLGWLWIEFMLWIAHFFQ